MEKTHQHDFHKNRRTFFTLVVLIALGLGLCGFGMSTSAAAANSADLAGIPLQADQQLLADYSLRFWQKINQARRAPLAEAARLGLDESTVRGVFGVAQWILDQGLPPLAWNENLLQSASAHGADMLARSYYGYDSPENIGPLQRIQNTGYQPAQADETISALFFNNFVDFDFAVTQLLDSMIRDELNGTRASRSFFDPALTETGVAFFAQTADLQPELPYVYLFVADFAAPIVPRRFVIIENTPGHAVAMKEFRIRGWKYLTALRAGVYQVAEPEDGALFIAIANAGLGALGRPTYLTTPMLGRTRGQVYLDLRF